MEKPAAISHSLHTISYINSGLMVVSALLALLFPFELFLFSILVLGPLHYLTEISWLDRKGFFIPSRNNIFFFVLLTLLISIPSINKKSGLMPYVVPLMAGAFAYAVGVIKHKSFWVCLGYFAVAFIIGVAIDINSMDGLVITFGILLPTMIHVLVFTGLFIIGGAIKNKTVPDYISVGVFIVCILCIVLPDYTFDWYTISAKAKELYIMPLYVLNLRLIEVLGMGVITEYEGIFKGVAPLKIMSLIAFAYTYHYLNWFSKTSVIKWHQVSKTRMVLITLVWAVIVAWCAWDYKTGFLVLSFLSLLHVVFEFPLNVRTMVDIKKALVG